MILLNGMKFNNKTKNDKIMTTFAINIRCQEHFSFIRILMPFLDNADDDLKTFNNSSTMPTSQPRKLKPYKANLIWLWRPLQCIDEDSERAPALCLEILLYIIAGICLIFSYASLPILLSAANFSYLEQLWENGWVS